MARSSPSLARPSLSAIQIELFSFIERPMYSESLVSSLSFSLGEVTLLFTMKLLLSLMSDVATGIRRRLSPIAILTVGISWA